MVQDTFRSETIAGEKTFTNFVATHNATAPRKLVLAAHYDSKRIPEGVFVGATDSALPCALLLALARDLSPRLAHRVRRLGITVQLILFDGEEAFEAWTDTDSLYGARHLAERWASTPSAVVANASGAHAPLGRNRPQRLVLTGGWRWDRSAGFFFGGGGGT